MNFISLYRFSTKSMNKITLCSLFEDVKLNSGNFVEWYRNFEIFLRYKNKL